MLRKLSLIFVLISLSFVVKATHNRAGEISFKHLGGLKYEITIITYTEISPKGKQADRKFLPIDWGDNSGQDSIQRYKDTILSDYIKKNIYIKSHEYAGPGRFMINVEDPNRNANVQNIPNSVNVVFYIESELIIDPFAGHNNSVQLLNPPIDFACLGNVFVHNPSAYDPDGDSLVFSLVASKGFNGVVIPGYTFPAATKSLSINSRTGQLIWDSPKFIGEHNVAILIEEYKNGIRVGSVLRDMQITVEPPCEHIPPEFEELNDEYCVVAGDTLLFDFKARDDKDGSTINDGNKVEIEATGSIFKLSNKAFFAHTTTAIIVGGSVYWRPMCSEVRKNPYSVVFRAVDNGDPNLSNFKTVNIRVLAPAVENFDALPFKNEIDLTWDRSICNEAIGYKIYRKLGASNFNPDTCQTGIPTNTGFKLLTTINSIDSLNFRDNDEGKGLILGLEYCYRIITFFKDGSESITSKEVCVQLKKELPVITNVSVLSTALDTGRVYLAWSKPTEHDTLVYPGPYKYVIRRRVWEEDIFTIATNFGINDTLYTDTLLNTTNNEYTYIIDMYDLSNGETLMGSSVSASSIYLNSLAEDNRLIIQWSEQVPWLNMKYVLYKENPISGDFELLDTITNGQRYIDDSLSNLVTYCYKLESIGEYLVSGLIKPIINFSQIHCNEPIDTVGPCPPALIADAISCDSEVIDESGSKVTIAPCGNEHSNVETVLSWSNPGNSCSNGEDVIAYELYYRPSLDVPFSEIFRSNNADDTTFKHLLSAESIAGCYFVTAIDSFGNKSRIEDTVCVDNCPYYILPNVFTPGNNDGVNDVFKPLPYCFIDKIDMTILNRWGQIVFETTDPDINWTGINQKTNGPAAEGVYFYVCIVQQKTLKGNIEKKLKGTIQLLRRQQ